jgi:hypothetical protein
VRRSSAHAVRALARLWAGALAATSGLRALHVEGEPRRAAPGDRFILRGQAPRWRTTPGAVVIDVAPPPLRTPPTRPEAWSAGPGRRRDPIRRVISGTSERCPRDGRRRPARPALAALAARPEPAAAALADGCARAEQLAGR